MSLRLLTAGESHGPALTAILEGLPAGLPLEPSIIDRQLARRQRGRGGGERMRIERDRVRISGGVMAGRTTGAPLGLLVENADHQAWKGRATAPMTVPRPGHADLTGAIKYGYRDLRPASERASARETTMRVAAGAVCQHLLGQLGIRVGAYVVAIGEVEAVLGDLGYPSRFEAAERSEVRCPQPAAAERMAAHIDGAAGAGDTLGGIIEIVALGLPVGLGSYAQWDRRLDARLGGAILSVQAIKGVEIGQAFANARRPGSQAHDAIVREADGARLARPTNRAGGLEGGVSNGQPLVIRAAMKPIASTGAPGQSVDLATGEPAAPHHERADVCPVPRAVVVLEAMTAYALADAVLDKLGGDSMAELRPRLQRLRRATLDDLPMDGMTHAWW